MDSWKEDRGKKVLEFMSEIKTITVEDERNKCKVKLNIKESKSYTSNKYRVIRYSR